MNELEMPTLKERVEISDAPVREPNVLSEPQRLTRVFSKEGVCPFDDVSWKMRDIDITDDKGKVVFTQKGVETPDFWSDLACKIVASKYFWGEKNTDQRERSVRQLIHRVCDTIATWAVEGGYVHPDDSTLFYNELCWLCLHQHAVFNSPVWFNVGLFHQYEAGRGNEGGWAWDQEQGEAVRARTMYEKPQCSACFIVSVADNMESLLDLAKTEAMLFKYGSGTGTDLTPIRSYREKLSGGGSPSGPMSFLRIYDQVAGIVKSGGRTRRAAKMNTIRDHHPDVEDFINAKMIEEKKARALIEMGYDGSINGDAYSSVMYQNENLSVRVSDQFMKAVTNGDGTWWTKSVTTGENIEKKDAKDLMRKMAEAAWFCGDPGVQFDGIIQRYHTCAGTEPINSTNPCAEYVFLNNTACNLASLNLVKFMDNDTFNVDKFRAAVRLVFMAQEILVDNSSYPTKQICENSHVFRTIGLGYANLGALLMGLGLPYNSDEGRSLAAAITAIMTGEAYATSAEMAKTLGPFPGFFDARCAHVKHPLKATNVASMGDVLSLHAAQASKLKTPGHRYLDDAARECWQRTTSLFKSHGVRNAQATVLAPTGTIAFMMDCDTTGIEPELSLVKIKSLIGGGTLTIVNKTVGKVLRRLNYNDEEIDKALKFIEKHGHLEAVGETIGDLEASPLKDDSHHDIFETSLPAGPRKRSLPHMAHIKMMAAVQPFLSGAISKTINMPEDSTVEDVMEAYVESWKLGLKCVAIYRDGSKKAQPLNVKKSGKSTAAPITNGKLDLAPYRHRLPDTRSAVTHKFSVGGHEGYLTVGLFENKQPGELFITMAKEGSTVGGLMDAIGTLTSLSLQYGVPLDALIRKFRSSNFEPSGMTSNPKIRMASSIIDYIFRWMGNEFVSAEIEGTTSDQTKTCPACGQIAQRTGTCYTCTNCGTSLGCS